MFSPSHRIDLHRALGALRYIDGSLYVGTFMGRHPHGAGRLVMANGRTLVIAALRDCVFVILIRCTATLGISFVPFDME
jgi:hypothetical protein